MLTAVELGITEEEHAALQVVRDGLASGKWPHAIQDEECYDKFNVGGVAFNMNWPHKKHDCGTVCCIGGFVGLVLGMNDKETNDYVHDADEANNPLRRLYYPQGLYGDWDSIAPAVAAQAITTFLDSGEVDYCALGAV